MSRIWFRCSCGSDWSGYEDIEDDWICPVCKVADGTFIAGGWDEDD